MGKGGLDL